MQIAGKLITPVPVKKLTKLEARQDGKWNVEFLNKKGIEEKATIGKNRGKRVFISKLMHEIKLDKEMQKSEKKLDLTTSQDAYFKSIVISKFDKYASITAISKMEDLSLELFKSGIKQAVVVAAGEFVSSFLLFTFVEPNMTAMWHAAILGAPFLGKIVYDAVKNMASITRAALWYNKKYL